MQWIWRPCGGWRAEDIKGPLLLKCDSTLIIYQIHLKSEVYIHLSQIHLISAEQFLTFNPSKKCHVLGQLGSPHYFKNVKCQNNSRENYLFQLLFL
jgi:hypothetical protein